MNNGRIFVVHEQPAEVKEKTMAKPTLDEMIDEAAKLPPGPDTWAPIFAAYPEITLDELAEKFRLSGERALREAEELEAYAQRRSYV